jgi:hypothetical protein
MPYVTVEQGPGGNPVYEVGGKSFVFFRNPRPDAVDPQTGERYADVIQVKGGLRLSDDAMAVAESLLSEIGTAPRQW